MADVIPPDDNTSRFSPLLDGISRRSQPRLIDIADISPIVLETDDSITIRRPVQFSSINSNSESQTLGHRSQATVDRYKYYSKLASHSRSTFLMPNHIVPPEYYLVLPIQIEDGKQSSFVTIFSIWNTMVGTSLLSMPWALEQSGFACGIVILFLMAMITLYTAYRVLNSPEGICGSDESPEFSDICRYYFGRVGEYVSVAFSLIALLGAAVVYWVLMSNFLYHSVKFMYDEIHGNFNQTKTAAINNITYDVFCPHPPKLPLNLTFDDLSTERWQISELLSTYNDPLTSNRTDVGETMFDRVWTETLSVPFFLVLVLGPLMNIKSPTFFTKFNSLGTVSIIYILVFVVVKSARWGVNLDFNPDHLNMYIPQFQWTFPALSGILSLALFIHNAVLSIVRNQRRPEHNARDLSIAYVCVTLTYAVIGILFYICFPLAKGCIEDNLLNNFLSSDIMSFVARLFLFFQMITVFPLLMYIFRIHLLNTVFGSIYPSWKHVLAVNTAVISLCLVFAIFMPKIGTIIRISGAVCGLVYIFALPCLVYMKKLHLHGALRWPTALLHCFFIAVGVANFIAQFLIMGDT